MGMLLGIVDMGMLLGIVDSEYIEMDCMRRSIWKCTSSAAF